MSLSLFDDDDSKQRPADGATPLAERMRPRTLDEFVGQQALVVQAVRCARPSNRIGCSR